MPPQFGVKFDEPRHGWLACTITPHGAPAAVSFELSAARNDVVGDLCREMVRFLDDNHGDVCSASATLEPHEAEFRFAPCGPEDGVFTLIHNVESRDGFGIITTRHEVQFEARDRRPHLVLPFWRALRKLAQRFEAVPDLAQHWPFQAEPLDTLTRALDLRRPF